MYLQRAAYAREYGQHATLRSEHVFYERMEERWMCLAASTALVERVDLFLNTLKLEKLPRDTCLRCQSVMAIEVIESAAGQEHYTLRCHACGATKQRSVMRYSLQCAN
jgi:hypothetical protein